MVTMGFRLSALALASMLVACGPIALEPPATPAPPGAFAQGRGLDSGAVARGDWWSAFDDPVLDALIDAGLRANLDLQQAVERIQRARAMVDSRRAELAPTGGIGAGARMRQLGEPEAPGRDRAARRSDLVTTTATLGWEIDLFGRIRHQAGAAEARADVATADAEAMRLAVTAEIAQAWFAIEGAREQLGLAQAVVENRRDTLALVLRRVGAGYGAAIDEARARADLAAAESDLPVRRAALAVATHRIAVLLGASPSDFEAPAAAPRRATLVTVHLPDPARWMASRPDLRSAEARLRAHSLDVASIRAEFMPRLTVEGVLGLVAGSMSGLGAAASTSWFVAPSLSLPIFDFARIDARLRAAQSGEREALLAYRMQVLQATEEVENALAQVREDHHQLAALHERARQAIAAERLARSRFEAGSTDLLELLDAQRTAQQAELGLAQVLTRQRQQYVALFRAFGARFVPADGARTAPSSLALAAGR